MRTWAARPREEAHLLNPAFCCTALAVAIGSYMKTEEEGVPFPLAFMVLPIVLHKPTRDALPRDIRTSMAAWLQENSSARVLFYERLVSLKPHTKEAIRFGMLLDWLALGTRGLLKTTCSESKISQAVQKLTDEPRECVMRARFLGKWFASAGATYTVMALWGVRP